ncbi:MAG: glycine dehydrogenase subunit 2 [Chloroflexi bacterium]|nr:glycine dehydrogenase subunit 2 [Chloroflexota bacterium]
MRRSPESGARTAEPALEPLLVELARAGRGGGHVPDADASAVIPARFRRTVPLALPELVEQQVVRHFTHLAQLNYSVDTGFYPLGSCTMKYNPKVNDRAAALAGFADLHPLQPEADTQGALRLIWELERLLAGITGMAEISLQPAAGAHAEFTSLLMFKAFHAGRGEGARRRRIIVPNSAHGTNSSSAALCGYVVTTVPSDPRGNVDLAALRAALGDDVAGMMLTNPNTLGLFEEHLEAVMAAVHGCGGLMYGDGANMNALLGIARPGDLGFDVLHLNLHKTFSTPHGAGGPGAGPVCATPALAPYLPVPRVIRSEEGRFRLDSQRPQSVGRVRAGHGNFGVLVRAYTYIRQLGEEGLRATGEDAVLAANYLLSRLRPTFDVAFDRPCMHELVLTLAAQKSAGASALDVAKALIDEGFHPPTVYFPLSVPEAMMIEPTETEPKETLDAFADALLRIAALVRTDPAAVRAAPLSAPLARLDEVRAARNPALTWERASS